MFLCGATPNKNPDSSFTLLTSPLSLPTVVQPTAAVAVAVAAVAGHFQKNPKMENPHTFDWHYSGFDDENFQIRGRTLYYAVVLFSIALLASLLLLLARWCGRRFSSVSGSGPGAPPPSQPAGGLDAATVNSFPVVLHESSEPASGAGESECCSICLGLFEDGEKVKVLPRCKHFYHAVCVDTWLGSQSSCPMCRSSLRPNSPV